MRVALETNGLYYVLSTNGVTVAGPFRTNAEAWRWIDRADPEDADDDERRARIRRAFSGE
jgi:hypothetical protein